MYTPIIQELDWDSKQFKFKVGKIELLNSEIDLNNLNLYINDIITNGQKNKYRLLYLMLPEHIYLSKDMISNKNILLSDRKVIYNKNINCCDLINPSQIHSYGFQNVCEQLSALSLISGKYSRFKLDPNFSNDVFEKMYQIWIEKSVSKEIADDVLVFEENNKILGMLTYKINNSSASIGLIAVDSLFQGKKIGSKLLMGLEFRLKAIGIEEINVATQKMNKDACNFYEKNNYKISSITNIYHIWL